MLVWNVWQMVFDDGPPGYLRMEEMLAREELSEDW